jgi:S-adenosylmethionine:tRNA ribosyltransferase-isomerase
MNLSDFHYDLPEVLIGQKAIEPRDSCRLLIVDRESHSISHHVFFDLLNILDSNTVLVINDTKVFPARLFGHKETGGKIEVLLLKQTELDSYRCLVRGKVSEGTKILFTEDFQGEVSSIEDSGEVNISFNVSGVALIEMIDKEGKTPLPPYIHSSENETKLRKQYQTVYAREKGSAAAPTAGLHFTQQLLDSLVNIGVEIEKVTLHVGLGTFKPVTEEQVATKTLHSETFFLDEDVASRLNKAKKNGKRIIAVGTTSCRLLETLSDEEGIIHAGQGETNIFIQPGYKFKFVSGLITNFHLPSTSLLMLVSALTLAPNTQEELVSFKESLIGQAYTEAVKKEYKFFSFGDAMMIV